MFVTLSYPCRQTFKEVGAFLDNFGLRQLTWNLADQVVSDIFIASPMDAEGRGISLSVCDGRGAADLTGATAYLVWTHRQTGKRGTTEFVAVDVSAGAFAVYYSSGSLVGGNGTAYASNRALYTYFRIDTAGTPGYLRAA